MTRFIFILFSICFAACNSEDDLDSFIVADSDTYNQIIKQGIRNHENWTTDPVLIAHKLFTVEDHPRTLKIELDGKDPSHLTVIHTLEGPYDDSVEGDKRIIKFKKIDNEWIIEEIKIGFKCWNSRGHTNYSGEKCS